MIDKALRSMAGSIGRLFLLVKGYYASERLAKKPSKLKEKSSTSIPQVYQIIKQDVGLFILFC
jgi:hypothetical protein